MLCERLSGARYSTLFFWSYYDPASQRLSYINAGHCPPLLLQTRNGETAIHRLEEGGPVLGLLTAAKYSQGTATLAPGDLLVLYSDGVDEAMNAAGEEFGQERLLDVVERYKTESAETIRREIVAAVRNFVGTAPATMT